MRTTVLPVRRSVELNVAMASAKMCDLADICPQPPVPDPLYYLRELAEVSLDDEVDRKSSKTRISVGPTAVTSVPPVRISAADLHLGPKRAGMATGWQDSAAPILRGDDP